MLASSPLRCCCSPAGFASLSIRKQVLTAYTFFHVCSAIVCVGQPFLRRNFVSINWVLAEKDNPKEIQMYTFIEVSRLFDLHELVLAAFEGRGHLESSVFPRQMSQVIPL